MKRIYLFDKVPFDTISKNALISTIVRWGRNHKKTKVFNMNTYGVVTFCKNHKFANIMNSADVIYPDGWGPVIASNIEGGYLMNRINVGDFIDDLFKSIQKNKLRIYFLGCEKKVVKRAALMTSNRYPKLTISGYHSGFFSKNDEKFIVRNLIKTKPHIVFIGMGVPFQEYFIESNWKKLPDAVYMGVGGVFYYITGLKTRAPKWMRQYSLEWLYRLLQEPRRLWRRYTLDNIYFMGLVLNRLLKAVWRNSNR